MALAFVISAQASPLLKRSVEHAVEPTQQLERAVAPFDCLAKPHRTARKTHPAYEIGRAHV